MRRAAAEVALLCALFGCSSERPNDQRPTLSRQEFASRCVVGDGYLQCKAGVGAPDRTQESTAGVEYWYFLRRTRDPVTGRVDNVTQVVIERGWIRAINFN